MRVQIVSPSPLSSPIGDCVAIRKSHECHSKLQAKNLTIANPYKCEILRLLPQDDIATQPQNAGEDEGAGLMVIQAL